MTRGVDLKKREKLTLAWRRQSAEISAPPASDDYTECAETSDINPIFMDRVTGTSAPVALAYDPGKSIRDRLENWALCLRMTGYGGAGSMTGEICDRMRSAALGNVWSGHSGAPGIDRLDAELVERAWRRMPETNHKLLLRWYYIRRAHPDMICHKLQIRMRPPSNFPAERRLAEQAIDATLMRMATDVEK